MPLRQNHDVGAKVGRKQAGNARGSIKIKVKTENLTILFVDIAGFTVATSRQSRQENARFLHVFNSTLLPLIARFEGRHIKSIGDALLLTFRSPTDAMLCAMALQDAMHAHNLNAPPESTIHIRVAAHLGEVRVIKKDIFGEPVNVAARIEGITPSQEIYLSEAVYMAMNKAEVPAQEVGFHELRGVAQPVRLYNIPRFSTHRLVPVPAASSEQGGELLYPYGGMHCQAGDKRLGGLLGEHQLPSWQRALPIALGGLLLAGGAAGAWLYLQRPAPARVDVTAAAPASVAKASPAPVASAAAAVASMPSASAAPASVAAPVVAAAPVTLVPPPAKRVAPVKRAASAERPAPAKIPSTRHETSSAPAPAWPPRRETPPMGQRTVPPKAKADGAAADSLASARQAYRDNTLSKAEYKQAVSALKAAYEVKIDKLKRDYRDGKISKAEYAERVRAAKIELKRGD